MCYVTAPISQHWATTADRVKSPSLPGVCVSVSNRTLCPWRSGDSNGAASCSPVPASMSPLSSVRPTGAAWDLTQPKVLQDNGSVDVCDVSLSSYGPCTSPHQHHIKRSPCRSLLLAVPPGRCTCSVCPISSPDRCQMRVTPCSSFTAGASKGKR